MKKIFKIFVFILIFVSVCFCLTSCDKTDYTLENIIQKHSEMIQEYQSGEENLRFNKNTINIKYNLATLKNSINKSNPTNAYERRYVALKYYDSLFEGIFSYYETYADSFYNSEALLSKNELNEIYNKLNQLSNELKSFNSVVRELEEELAILGVENPPTLTITNFAYEYNKLVEKSISFMDSFINIHKKKIFGEEQNDINALIRNFEEAKFDIARLCFYENFKSLNNVSGTNGVCDLECVVASQNDSSFDNSKYILLLDLLKINSLTPVNIEKIENLRYYKSSYDQNFKVYKTIYDGFDMFNLEMNRLNGFAGANVESYISRFVNAKRADYEFMVNFKFNILKSYYNAVIDVTIEW